MTFHNMWRCNYPKSETAMPSCGNGAKPHPLTLWAFNDRNIPIHEDMRSTTNGT